MNEFEAAIIGDEIPLKELQARDKFITRRVNVVLTGIGLREEIFEGGSRQSSH